METKKPKRRRLIELLVNETDIFPIEDTNSVRTTIYLLGLQKQYKYTTQREGNTLRVTRVL
jgi:hypothetical protein